WRVEPPMRANGESMRAAEKRSREGAGGEGGKRWHAYNGTFLSIPKSAPSLYLLYSVLLALGFVLALPVFLWRGRATGKYFRTFRERMGRLPVSLNVDGDRS